MYVSCGWAGVSIVAGIGYIYDAIHYIFHLIESLVFPDLTLSHAHAPLVRVMIIPRTVEMECVVSCFLALFFFLEEVHITKSRCCGFFP
jgi:hypothetical protein